MAEKLATKNALDLREEAQSMVRGQRFLDGVRTLFDGLEGNVLHTGATNGMEFTFDERNSEVTFYPVRAIRTWLQRASYKGASKFTDIGEAQHTSDPFIPRNIAVQRDIYTGDIMVYARSESTNEEWGITRMRTAFEIGDCTMSIRHISADEQTE